MKKYEVVKNLPILISVGLGTPFLSYVMSTQNTP